MGKTCFFTIEICYLFAKIYSYIFKNTKICTYMPKISKKEHIYPISDYYTSNIYIYLNMYIQKKALFFFIRENYQSILYTFLK